MEKSLQELLEKCARQHNVELAGDDAQTQFINLIDTLAQHEKVVILIDEYDKPILDNITNPLVKDILNLLRGFYSVVKGTEALQRFVFMTGVSKFSHVSVFSNLNNLTDITMEAGFATMPGYTQEELEYYFGDRIELLVEINQSSKEEMLRKIKLWYNGYRFEENSQTVYNPVSLVQFFRNNGKFNNYWFKTGTTRVLLELMKDSNADYVKTLTMPETSSFFDSFEISTLKPKTLLYQTGYLTIDKCVETPGSVFDGNDDQLLSAFPESGSGKIFQRESVGILCKLYRENRSGCLCEPDPCRRRRECGQLCQRAEHHFHQHPLCNPQ